MPSLSRFKASILRRSSSPSLSGDETIDHSPESEAKRAVRLFCESGAAADNGEEVAYLPVIVEAAESSPAAAATAAYQIRKYLSKDSPAVQYNAIMLLRILAENPGPAFTQNVDTKFVTTVNNLLRSGRDQSVQQVLRETLDALEAERSHDVNLKRLIDMWRMVKGHSARFNAPTAVYIPTAMSGANGRAQASPSRRLPAPEELASRVEEGKNSAKILVQLVQSTPLDEILTDGLIKEFSERCQNAQASLQGYISCDDPAPDPDTMQTLIETSEQLSLSLSKTQRAKLGARRTLGLAATSGPTTPNNEQVQSHDFATAQAPALPSREKSASPEPTLPKVTVTQNPFGDSAERSTLPQTSRATNRRSMYTSQTNQTDQTNTRNVLYASGANGPGTAAAESSPAFRY